MVHYFVTTENKIEAKQMAEQTGRKYYDCLTSICPRIPGKTKKELLLAGSQMAKSLGVSECWIDNITSSEDYKVTYDDRGFPHKVYDSQGLPIRITIWCLAQTWYVFNDGTGWRFKMRDYNKTSHPIEGAE